MTPDELARLLVETICPSGIILEPCAGNGAFVRALRSHGHVHQLDIEDGGMGFSWWTEHVNWIVTNPPWSQFRMFLHHALEVADHVAFLATVNHWWTRRRVEDVRQADFGYRHLVLCDWPVGWPASGFQLGMMHLERGYRGPLVIERLES